MLTIDEIRAVPLFSVLAECELERLVRTAADLHVAAGEFAVPEGGERALYAVLSGKFQVVKTFDGVERTLGWRLPGTIFGEVPLAFGTAFPGGYRAVEPSRVMRVETREYYALSAASPEFAMRMGALARERIAGLQSVTATEQPRSKATIFGKQWDPACGELRRFLTRNQITHDWISPDSPDIARHWPGERPADPVCPIVRLADGTVSIQPSRRELAHMLGLQTEARCAEYDTVIIGAGPAGLAAAVYGASEGLRTLVIEREAPGGQAGTSSRIENYLGFPNGVSGEELASRALQQARRLGAEILVTRTAVSMDPATCEVTLDGGDVVRAETVILATGVTWRRLDIEGLYRFIGKGVHYGAARSDSTTVQGHDVHFIGAGNSAGQAAMHLASHAKTVTLVVRGDTLDRSMSRYLVEQMRAKSNIAVQLHSEVHAAHGETHLTAVDIIDRRSGAVSREDSGGLFVFIGADADTRWLPAEIARDAHGYVLTGHDVAHSGRWAHHRDPFLLETSVPGVFACGDVRLSPIKRVAAAVGEGSMAIALVRQALAQDGAKGRG